MISRRLSMYSWMIRRASSERGSLGGRSNFTRARFFGWLHAPTVGREPKGTIEPNQRDHSPSQGMERDQHDRSIGTPGPAPKLAPMRWRRSTGRPRTKRAWAGFPDSRQSTISREWGSLIAAAIRTGKLVSGGAYSRNGDNCQM